MSEQTSRLAIILDSSGAQRNAEGLAGALQKMTQAGELAEKSTEDLSRATGDLNSWLKMGPKHVSENTKATDEQREAYRKLRDQIDPVSSALNKLDDRFQELTKYQKMGIVPDDDFADLSEKIRETERALNGETLAQRESERASKLAAAQHEAQAKAFQSMLDRIDPVSGKMRELNEQQKAIYTAAQDGSLSLEQYDSYSKKLHESKKELTGVAQAQREAEKAAKDAIKEQEAQALSFQRMIDKIDPLDAAIRSLEHQQNELSKALSSGKIDTEQYDAYNQKLQQTRREITGEAQAARDVAKAHEEQGASLQRLVSQLDPFSSALDKIKRQRAELSAARDSGLLSPEYHAELSSKLDLTEKSIGRVSQEMRYGSISAGQYKNAMRMLPAQFTDIATSIAGGMPLWLIMMQQGGQISDSFGGIGNIFEIIKDKLFGASDAADEASDSLSDSANALGENADHAQKLTGFINPVTIGIGALIAVVGTLTYAWYRGTQEQQDFHESLVMTGNTIGVTTGQLADMARAVGESTGNTTGAAAEALNRVVSGGKIAKDSMRLVTEAVVSMNDATGQSVDSMVSDFEKIAKSPVAAIGELNDKYHHLTLATYNQVKALQDEGNQQEAARVATEAHANAINQRANEIAGNLGTLQRAWKWLGDEAKGAWDAMLDIGREQSLDEKIKSIEDAITKAQAVESQPVISGFAPLDSFNAKNPKQDSAKVKSLKEQLATLRTQKSAQDALNESRRRELQIEQDAIGARIKYDSQSKQMASNEDKRKKELADLDDWLKKMRAAGDVITPEDEAKHRKNINDKYKDRKTPKGKEYAEDAAKRLLDQLNQQNASMQLQLESSDRIGTAQQALVKWEQQLADIKTKKTLTADQKSLLANESSIRSQYQKNASLEKEIALRKDAEKLTAYQNTLNLDFSNSSSALSDRLNSNTILSEEQKRQKEILSLRQDFAKKQAELTNQRTTGQVSQNLYAAETAALNTELQRRLVDLQAFYTKQDALNSNWQLGLQNGLQSYMNSIPSLYDSVTAATTSILQSTENAISSNMTAMVLSTKSLSDGFKDMAAGMGQAVIDALMKMAAQWLVYQAVQLLVGKTAAISAGSSMTTNAVAMSQMAALNAYASTAAIPIIGPGLAPAAAGVATAFTAPLAASIGALSLTGMAHNGIDSVPSTGTWLLEKGERVMTAQTSARLDATLENLRKNGLDATLSKPGFGTGVQGVDNSQQTTVISPQINMPPITINGNPSDATIQLVNQAAANGARNGYNAAINDLASKKGKMSMALRNIWAVKPQKT